MSPLDWRRAASPGDARGMADAPADTRGRWLGPGVAGIGAASFLADVGHEIPTALLPNLLTATLGAPAAALGLIEGLSDGLAGAARLAAGLITSAVTGYSWSRNWLTRGCGG